MSCDMSKDLVLGLRSHWTPNAIYLCLIKLGV